MNHNILHICSIITNGLQQLEKRQRAPHPIISIKVEIGRPAVQKPTQELKSVNNTDNIFDLKPKWSRTFP
jgi:hypothetical protein